MISDGSVGTFCSKITLPASSTTHTDVSFTDTSRPTKCAISSLLPRCSRSPDLDPFIATEGDARSASKAEPQPPRYTIFPNHTAGIRSAARELVFMPPSRHSLTAARVAEMGGLGPSITDLPLAAIETVAPTAPLSNEAARSYRSCRWCNHAPPLRTNPQP